MRKSAAPLPTMRSSRATGGLVRVEGGKIGELAARAIIDRIAQPKVASAHYRHRIPANSPWDDLG